MRKNEGRLSPFEFDKLKDAENSPFEASSVLVVKANLNERNCLIMKNNMELTPYAKLFINYQQPGGDLFEPDEALKNGTVFPALYIPYKNKWEVKKWLEMK